MSDDASARLALPFLSAGQAQKEMTVNEALARLDAAVQASAIAGGATVPPATPSPGACWIVGAAPEGDWAGNANALAVWTGDGWRFLSPVEGMTVWVAADGMCWRWRDGSWRVGEVLGSGVTIDGIAVVGVQQPAIAGVTGGTIVDAECRMAVSDILEALRAHGLIAT